MAAKKVVLFDLWGCVQTPPLHHIFEKYEESLGLQRNFIQKAVEKKGAEGALSRAELGKLTLTQMIPELEAECQEEASSQGLTLPPQFSVQKLCDLIREAVRFNTAILDASAQLRRHGVATCVLGNSWVDDSEKRDWMGLVLWVLQLHFDLVLQSCRAGARLPDPALLSHALQRLDAEPQQAIFVSSVEERITAGRDIGIGVVQMEDPESAMKQLESLSGVELLSSEDACPLACNPEDVPHCFVTIKPGTQMHYVDVGEGPVVLLCHGFPDCWFGWRYQILALAESGFRVLAPDMKGYGDSVAPLDIEEYTEEQICQDLVTFLDKLGIVQVTLVGDEWGGALAWTMARYHPERVRAVASLNTPLIPADPNMDFLEFIKSIPTFGHGLYYQTPGVAEAELGKNLERTFKIFLRGAADLDTELKINPVDVCKRGGLFVGLPDEVPLGSVITEEVLQFYIKQFSKSGFRGPLNWYRNLQNNWVWQRSRPIGKVIIPALMVTEGKDLIFHPKLTEGMENMLSDLKREHIEECGHWSQIERPAELNKILLSWLKDVHQKAAVPLSPKL